MYKTMHWFAEGGSDPDGMGWDGMGCVPVLCRTRIVTILHLNACAINLRRVNAVMAI